MSEKFRKGDRVKVEYEGTVTWAEGKYLEVDGDAVRPQHVTLIERPVEPLAPGSVVRNGDGTVWVVGTEQVAHVLDSGHVAVSGLAVATLLAENVQSDPNYVILHDGSTK